MTAGDRLALVSGLSGVTAAAMLAAIGAGATTGDALVNYSGLASATAAVHLLTDIAPSAPPGVVFSDPPIQIMQGQRKKRKPTDLLLLLLT